VTVRLRLAYTVAVAKLLRPLALLRKFKPRPAAMANDNNYQEKNHAQDAASREVTIIILK